MWRITNGISECERVCDSVERMAGRFSAPEAVLEQLHRSARAHIGSCEACSDFLKELTEVRAMFEVYENKVQPSPFFLTRVMASIAAREAHLERSGQTWAAVPHLAYRLSVLASLSLLIAASWVYEMPKSYNSGSLNSQQYAEGLADSGQVQDDLLVGAVSR